MADTLDLQPVEDEKLDLKPVAEANPKDLDFGARGTVGDNLPIRGQRDLVTTDLGPAPVRTQAPQSNWDKRADGSRKGNGYLGALNRPDGSVSSEISVSTDEFDGKEFPAVVPTLSPEEVSGLLNLDLKKGKVPPAVIEKAAAYARERQAKGLPLFAGPGEENNDLYPQFTRSGGGPVTASAPSPAQQEIDRTTPPQSKLRLTPRNRMKPANERAQYEQTYGEHTLDLQPVSNNPVSSGSKLPDSREIDISDPGLRPQYAPSTIPKTDIEARNSYEAKLPTEDIVRSRAAKEHYEGSFGRFGKSLGTLDLAAYQAVTGKDAGVTVPEAFGAGAEAVNSATEIAQPVMAAGMVAAPVAALTGIATGAVASQAAGYAADKLGASPEEKQVYEAVGFFLPSFVGSALGLRSSFRAGLDAEGNPIGARTADILGGRAGVGYAQTGEGVHVAGKVGPYKAGVSIPFGKTASEAPALAEGQAQLPSTPPVPAAQVKMQSVIQDMAARKAGVTPPSQIPPPPPGPTQLTPEIVQAVADVIASHPEAARTPLLLEAHQNLAKWMVARGSFVGPDGKLYTVKNEQQAQTLAAKLINEQVAAHDQATAKAPVVTNVTSVTSVTKEPATSSSTPPEVGAPAARSIAPPSGTPPVETSPAAQSEQEIVKAGRDAGMKYRGAVKENGAVTGHRFATAEGTALTVDTKEKITPERLKAEVQKSAGNIAENIPPKPEVKWRETEITPTRAGLVGRDVTPQEAVASSPVERIKQLREHPAELEKQYDALGRPDYISADKIKELAPGWENKEGRAELTGQVHQESSKAAAALFTHKLAKVRNGEQVELLTGPVAAGKTTYSDQGNSALTLEVNLSDPKIAHHYIDKILAQGAHPTITYVYVTPQQSAERRAKRFDSEDGRPARIETSTAQHIELPRTIAALAKEYGDKLQVRAIDNSGNEAQEIPITEVDGKAYNDSREGLLDEQQSELDRLHAAGEISDRAHAANSQAAGRPVSREGTQEPARSGEKAAEQKVAETGVEHGSQSPTPDAGDTGEAGRALADHPRESRQPLADLPAEVPRPTQEEGATERPLGRSSGRDSDQPAVAGEDREPPAPGPAGGDSEPELAAARGAELEEKARAERAPARNRDWFSHPKEFSVDAGNAQRLEWNLTALKLLKTLEAEDRLPTAAERDQLAHYVGWGAIPHVFDPYRAPWGDQPKWRAKNEELRNLITSEQFDAARKSTMNAHYTAPDVVRFIWQAMSRLGFKDGIVLEPSMGSGNFFGMMPAKIRGKVRAIGNELDPLTYKIAKYLYPSADLFNQDFVQFMLPDNSIDLAVGNVPFGEKIYDPRYPKLKARIHDYFFVKTLDKVRPGGIVAYITSDGTLDKRAGGIRELLADKADLIAAFRLPSTAFEKSAGTQVVTDLIILKKREQGAKAAGEKFTELTSKEVPYGPDYAYEMEKGESKSMEINQYYADHPENVLGKMVVGKSMYGNHEDLRVEGKGVDVAAALEKALASLPRNIFGLQSAPPLEVGGSEMTLADPGMQEGAFSIKDGKIVVKSYGRLVDLPERLNRTTYIERIKAAIGVRDALAALLSDMRSLPDDEGSTVGIKKGQAALKKVYDSYVKKHGFLSEKRTKDVFEDEPSYPLLLAIEHYDRTTKLGTPAEIFTKRTLFPPTKLTTLSADPAEAFYQVLAERGEIDIPLMQSLSGKSAEQIEKEIEQTGLVFRDPSSGRFELRDVYLSGYVRDKLRDAERMLEQSKDEKWQRNIEALKKVIPENLTMQQIGAEGGINLGATWIPPEAVAGFLREKLGAMQAKVATAFGAWSVSNVYQSAEVTGEYAGGDWNAGELIQAALNQKDPVTFDTIRMPDGKDKQVVNQAKTIAAKQAMAKVKKAFSDYIQEHPRWAPDLAQVYNEKLRNMVPFEADGSHQTFPGMNPTIKLQPHQSNAIWRIVVHGRALLAHVVGAGKTFEMIGAAMELKRLGKIRKPVFAVPNHLTAQWAADYHRLYPGARVLAPSKKDFEKTNRNRLMARIATGNWDGVIVPHSFFDLMDISPEFQERTYRKQMDELEETINAVRETQGKRDFSVKQLEKAKANLQARLSALADLKADKSIMFDQTGIDQLFVDEAHEYKNLPFYTKMTRVAGLPQSNTKKTLRLKMKTDYLLEKQDGRGIVFATGTPVANTMAEMRHMTTYIAPDVLERAGIRFFDDWAANFGQKITAMEISPDGRTFKPRTKFAKFVNVPELLMMWKSFADVKTAEDLQLPVPKMEGGKPIPIAVPSNPVIEPIIQNLINRAAILRGQGIEVKDAQGNTVMTEKLDDKGKPVTAKNGKPVMVPKLEFHTKPKPEEDNMLKVTGEGRKVATDARLINPDLADHPDSKVNQVVNKIFEEWNEDWNKKNRATGLVFLDNYQYTSPGYKITDELGEVKTKKPEVLLNLYHDMRDKLVARGVPKDEIAIIHDYKTDLKKLELFDAVNAGKVRIMFGSTYKMGAGMNVQRRLKWLIDMDSPWKPGELEQRHGRIIRQGNIFYEADSNYTVRLYHAVTKGSFDTYMLQTLEGKASFIAQVTSGRFKGRSMTDAAGDMVLTLEEMKAIASGNPDVKKKMELEAEVATLNTLRTQHQAQIAKNKFRAEKLRHEAGEYSAKTDAMEGLAAEWKAASADDKFHAKILGKEFTKYGDAMEWLKEQARPAVNFHIEVNGIHFVVSYDQYMLMHYTMPLINEIHAVPENQMAGLVPSIMARMRNLDHQIETRKKFAAQDIEKAEKLEKMGEGFEQQADLDKAEKELSVVNTRLGITDENAVASESVEAAPSDSSEGDDLAPDDEEPSADAAPAPFGWDAVMGEHDLAADYDPGDGALAPVITLNQASSALVADALQFPAFAGVNMSPAQARFIATKLRVAGVEASPARKAKIYQIAKMFEAAAESYSAGGVIAITDNGNHERYATSLREEMFHGVQRSLGYGAVSEHVGNIERLISHPTAIKLRPMLEGFEHYKGQDEAKMVSEMAAKIAAAQPLLLDYATVEELADWYTAYLEEIENKAGFAGVEKLKAARMHASAMAVYDAYVERRTKEREYEQRQVGLAAGSDDAEAGRGGTGNRGPGGNLPVGTEATAQARAGGEAAAYDAKENAVDSPAFKKWFGDSKVVNPDGTPMVLYHGTYNDIERFSRRGGMAGHFGTADAANQRLEHLIDDGRRRDQVGQRVMPVYLSIQRPAQMTDVHFDETLTMLEDLVERGVFTAKEAKELGRPFSFSATRRGESAYLRGIVKALKGKGFDGIKYENNIEDPGSVSWIPFEGTQIKSASGNSGNFDPSNPDINAAPQAQAPTFYSQAQKTIAAKMPNTASPEQVLGILRNPTSGVKADELKWLGLDEFLKDKQKVTKQEVLDFIRENNVQVKEVINGTPNRRAERYRELDLRISAGETLTPAEMREMDELDAHPEAPEGATKFSQYQLPGGESYRELLLTLPQIGETRSILGSGFKRLETDNIDRTMKEITGYEPGMPVAGYVYQKGDTGLYIYKHDGKYVVPIGGDERVTSTLAEAERVLNDDFAAQEGLSQRSTAFTSSHFDEPNVVAHVRFNDRTDADGKKVLFLEELQSDWHQKGRKLGYGDIPKVKAADLKVAELSDGSFSIETQDGRRIEVDKNHAVDDAGARAYGEGYFNSEKGNHPTVPDAPFKKTWHELALKRMLRYSAENGYDKLAWTPGSVQNDRYDLSKHVSKVEYSKRGELTAWDKNGAQAIHKHGVTKEELPDYIGKEAAEKLINDERLSALGYAKLEGLELQVGGSGMKGFYDQIIPRFLSDYGKKWGAKVGESRIYVGDKNLGDVGIGHDLTVRSVPKVPSIPITAEMKQSVMDEGQPLFAGKRNDKNTATFNGKRFWIGSASTLDGKIEEVYTHKQAEDAGFHHSHYFSPTQLERTAGGENAIFWVDPNGTIHLWDEFEKGPAAVAELKGQIKKQISTDEAPSFAAPASKFKFEDADVAKAIEEARGIKPKSSIERIKEGLERTLHLASRKYEFLPNGAQFEPLRFQLTRLEKQRGVASDKAARHLGAILDDLSEAQYFNFSMKVLLDDLKETAADGMQIPFYTDLGMLERDQAALSTHVAQDKTVAAAVDFRRQVWAQIKDDYTAAMEKIGFKVADRLKRDSYYRHMILEYANQQEQAVAGSGKKLKTPTGRGFLRQRKGSNLPINTDYLQAEHEVMAQMLFDIEVARTIKFVDDKYNIVEHLKRAAVVENEANIMELFDAMEKAGKIPDGKGAEDLMANLNRKQAMGFGRLFAMASENELPVGSEGQWQWLVDELATNYEQNLAKKEEMEENWTPNDRIELTPKARKGLFAYANYLMKAHQGTQAWGAAASIFKGIAEKKKYLKEKLGADFTSWKDLVPDGYSIWQPREGSLLYFTKTIPEHVVEQLQDEAAGEIGITREQLRSVLARGSRFREFVVPTPVQETLDHLRKEETPNALARGLRPLVRAWKIWTLTSPRRFFKYNFRNLSGDAEPLAVGNPSAFAKVGRSASDLWAYYKNHQISPMLNEWLERGGTESLLQAQEMGDINQLKMFARLHQAKGTIKEVPVKLWQGYWKSARMATDFRESVLRYAAFIDYYEQVTGNPNGLPNNYGASSPEEVKALTSKFDRAFKLSNELLGAYDQLTALGQDLRKNVAPFWSFQEVNAKRALRMMLNLGYDPKGERGDSYNKYNNDDSSGWNAWRFAYKTVGAGARKSPFIAYKLGKFLMKLAAFWAIVTGYNYVFFQDEERELSDDLRARPHMIFGRNADGSVRYIGNLGSFSELLAWFGLDAPQTMLRDWLDGKKTARELAKHMMEGTANKAFGSVSPFIKAPFELATGLETYPDVFSPRAMRDRKEYLARILALEHEYRAVTGKPTRGYMPSIAEVFFNRMDKGSTAYYDILQAKRAFLEKQGKGGMDISWNPRSEALRNFRLAMHYGDERASEKYLNEYFALGGTAKGMRRSIASMNPLYGLKGKDRVLFLASLGTDSTKLGEAMSFYASYLSNGVQPPSDDEEGADAAQELGQTGQAAE